MKPLLTVLDTASLLREEADERISGRIAALPQGGAEITCRAGCHACCHQLVVVSPMEAQALRDYVRERPDLARAIEARLEAWERRLDELPELRKALEQFDEAGGYLAGEEGGRLELDYWRAQLPCPFLDGGLCSVYPVRPFACREHHVVSDPALCARSPDDAVSAGTRLEFRAVASWTGEACFDLSDRLILLARALAYAADHPDEPERTAQEEEVRTAAADAQRRARMALARLLFGA